ncbi:Spore membrane assembly protein 2 [Wickerhamomyces ciferrii]|uniref:Spore membrane assembly protein 2 n=1 Tax=Wickerhamomyces ciferrii (strain ATCC 14091 / BCRC 22168 / CBS 111 / JCM 3599 / NBRC 0793 / NRRL Y-1031 F-60-10) TaxID=1206466 RepID=K0KV23_WICCF|nr:Spore membrane assembly protein 2 [Wickerhamomyces ciferrii]CCH45752.1 Spore membrane assembly protein 2 [Wickerhamomyces ciferrii]
MDPFMLNGGSIENQFFRTAQSSQASQSLVSTPNPTDKSSFTKKPYIKPTRIDFSPPNSASTYGSSSMTKLKRSHTIVDPSPSSSSKPSSSLTSKFKQRARSHYITGNLHNNNNLSQFDVGHIDPNSNFKLNDQQLSPNFFENQATFLSPSPRQDDEFNTAQDEIFQQEPEREQNLNNLDDVVSQIFTDEKDGKLEGDPSANAQSEYFEAFGDNQEFGDKEKEDKEVKYKQKDFKDDGDEEYEDSFEIDDETGDKKFKTTFVSKLTNAKYLTCSILLVVLLCVCLVLNSFPLFTCHHTNSICFPQLTIQLTDKSPAAKNALLTVREALKVITYLAIDFGDNTSELDMINTRLDSYYQNKVIDTFSVNTIFHLNYLGYCREGYRHGKNFCMRSYGLDLLSVFVRDAGVQLGELTKTNVDIMGDSFAIAYELAISGFNEFSNNEQHESVEYINYAILLQKLSKGLGFLTVSQFSVNCALLLGSLLLVLFKNTSIGKKMKLSTTHRVRKWLAALMVSLSFINLLIGFLMCSLTFEFILRLSEIGQSVGIANVNRALGFSFIWISFVLQIFNTSFIVCLANGLRKNVY